jgi:hypothetical protein
MGCVDVAKVWDVKCMGCVDLVKVWVVYMWLWYGLCRCGYGVGCVGVANVWVV